MPSSFSSTSKTGGAPPPPAPKPPAVALEGPHGAFLVELLVYNGSPVKDHWAYFVCSHGNRDIGVKIHATGDMPLQWVDAQHLDEKAMLNHGKHKNDTVPVCGFEASVHKAKAPEKTLNSAEDMSKTSRNITQKDCQSWLVESAEFLVQDRIFNSEVAVYLHAIEQ
ncbi:hypothetical protein LZ30DRAFT_745512 [Colletotrichum cereale]|nr:hypothetical protein LZ30DRAFT_745512 [Colletotrichum cereale]